MNTFKMPIGDWSGDGHNQCEYFELTTKRSIEEVRETHFSCFDKLGFGIGDINSEYGDYEFPAEIKKTLVTLGFDMAWSDDGVNPDELAKLWVGILDYLDPLGDYEFVNPETVTVPTITFYGFDDAGRHLESPGYGLFD